MNLVLQYILLELKSLYPAVLYYYYTMIHCFLLNKVRDNFNPAKPSDGAFI